MRVIFLGSPAFAIPSLEAVLKSNHEVIAVVTQPDAIADRGHQLKACEVKEYALKNNLKVLQYDKISKQGADDLRALKPDIMVTVAYGQILSQEIIDIPKYGIINVHASLLPKYRGASPVQTAIIEGETVTGITIMQTEAGLDTGDILNVIKVAIFEDETAGELSLRLADEGSHLLVQTLNEIENGTVNRIKQVQTDATFTTKLSKMGCTINFNKPANKIVNLIRGSNPNPVARTGLGGEIVKIYSAKVREDIASTNKTPRTIIEPTSAKAGVFVQCGVGVVEILTMQLPNGKVVDAKCLVGGRKLQVGMTFDEYATVVE